jgi:hypothetical protein
VEIVELESWGMGNLDPVLSSEDVVWSNAGKSRNGNRKEGIVRRWMYVMERVKYSESY